MYNQNPSMYGSSIYSSYNWWSPSNQFNNYSSGLSIGFSTGNYYGSSCGYGGYNPYGYNPYYSNNSFNSYGGYGYNPYGYNPYGFNSYGNGYMNGYNNGFYSGSNWGYFNSYDVNSSYSHAEYGPRGSNGGSNSPRQTTAGMVASEDNNARMQFIKEVAIKQESDPKFIDVPRKVFNNNGNENLGNGQIISSEPVKGRGSYANDNYQNNNINTNTSPKKEQSFWPKVFDGNQNSNPGKSTGANMDSPRNESTSPGKVRSSQMENNNINTNTERSNNSGNFNNGGNNGGGSSSPRGSGGGGGSSRPR
jgi:hypothetical protein